eukprot:2900467-Pyramimonas_sp.AAC.1
MLAVSLSAHRLRDHMAAAPYLNGHDNGSSESMSTPASYTLLAPSEGPAVMADQTDGDSVDYYGLQRHSL